MFGDRQAKEEVVTTVRFESAMKKIKAGDIPLLAREVRLAIIGEHLATQGIRHTRTALVMMTIGTIGLAAVQLLLLPTLALERAAVLGATYVFAAAFACAPIGVLMALARLRGSQRDLRAAQQELAAAEVDTSGLTDDEVFYRALLPQLRHQGWKIEELDRPEGV